MPASSPWPSLKCESSQEDRKPTLFLLACCLEQAPESRRMKRKLRDGKQGHQKSRACLLCVRSKSIFLVIRYRPVRRMCLIQGWGFWGPGPRALGTYGPTCALWAHMEQRASTQQLLLEPRARHLESAASAFTLEASREAIFWFQFWGHTSCLGAQLF